MPKRSRYIQNTIGDLDDSSDFGIYIRMEAISTKERFNPRKSDYEDVYKAEYRWRAINHKHNIFNERIFDNDFTRANIISAIRRKRESRARSDGIIKAAIDGIRLVKRRISQLQTQLINDTNSLSQELENVQIQLTSLQKESENRTFLQEKHKTQLENLGKSLESMY